MYDKMTYEEHLDNQNDEAEMLREEAGLELCSKCGDARPPEEIFAVAGENLCRGCREVLRVKAEGLRIMRVQAGWAK